VKPEGTPIIERSYTWDELGIDPELRSLMAGEVHLYRSADGAQFQEVTAPAVDGYLAGLVGGDDGYRLLTGSLREGVHQLFSADGETWTSSGADLSGWVLTSGSLAGTPAAVVTTDSGATLLTAAPGGGWDALDLMGAVGVTSSASRPAGVVTAGVGPLGLIAVVSADGTPANTFVVDSADGRRFTTHSIAELAGAGDWSIAGVAMNADAATVRLMPAAKPSDGTTFPPPPGPQRLLVGTPG
jgi:hypothetical protein